MDSFYITLQSDSSMIHFPDNSITSFKNHYSEPIRLDNFFEVAMVECSYVHSRVLVDQGEIIGTCEDTGMQVKAQRLIFDVFDIVDTIKMFVAWRAKDAGKEYIHKDRGVMRFITSRANLEIERDAKTGLVKVVSCSGIRLTPRLKYMLGWADDKKGFAYNVFEPALRTQLYVYCDIIENQRVGGEVAPLLRKMTYVGEHDQVVTRNFPHLQYVNVAYTEFDKIWMYIRNETGQPPPFITGAFSCTLHFRRKRY